MPRTEYEKDLEETKKKIDENAQSDPCYAFEETVRLIRRLEITSSTYWPRPCGEGWCLGIFAPHRSRIAREIKSLTSDQTIFDKRCTFFQANKREELAVDAAQKMYKDYLGSDAGKFKKTTSEEGVDKKLPPPFKGNKF